MLTHKHNLANLSQLARVFAPALVVPLMLILCTAIVGEPIEGPYVLLAFGSAALAHIVIGPAFRDGELESGSESSAATRVLLGWAVLIAVLLAVGYAAKVSEFFPRRILLMWFISGGVALVAVHYAVRNLARYVMRLPEMARTVVVAGVNEVSLRLAGEIGSHPELGMRLIGFFDDRSPERLNPNPVGELIGTLSKLPEYVKLNKTDVIFIALPLRHVKRVLDLLDELNDTTASIYFVPDVFVFDLIQSRVHSIRGMPTISLCETPFYGYRGLVKRALDVALALVALVVLLVPLLIVAVLIRATSRGSVVFRQRRYGLDGREIVVYKFRTMYVSEDSERVVQATRGDPRVTPIGRILRKLSIDELRQLVNVLQGRMSLVGPRPHAVAHNEEYRKLIKGYMIRHKVLPGITGWAQVNGCRGETSALEDMKARVEYDLEYLRNWSLALDIKILFLTVWTLFRTDKAY